MSHRLRSRQLEALQLLARGHCNDEVIKTMGLQRGTLSRWRRIPEFNQELDRLMIEVHDDMRHHMLHLANASILAAKNQLLRYQSDPKVIQAALNVFKLVTKAPETVTNMVKTCQDVPERANNCHKTVTFMPG